MPTSFLPTSFRCESMLIPSFFAPSHSIFSYYCYIHSVLRLLFDALHSANALLLLSFFSLSSTHALVQFYESLILLYFSQTDIPTKKTMSVFIKIFECEICSVQYNIIRSIFMFYVLTENYDYVFSIVSYFFYFSLR